MTVCKAFVLVLTTAALLHVFISCSAARTWQLKPEGDKIIARIEEYRKKTGRLPQTLDDVGIRETEEGPVYYKKESDDRYIVWFGLELGESVTYDSADKNWNK